MDITINEVIHMLRPNAEYTIKNRDFSTLEFFDDTVLTQAEFEAGFAKYEALKAEQEAKAEADKTAAQAKLAALGLTADDLKALGL